MFFLNYGFGDVDFPNRPTLNILVFECFLLNNKRGGIQQIQVSNKRMFSEFDENPSDWHAFQQVSFNAPETSW